MKTTHFCEKCNYSTILKQNFNRHLVSEKHTSPTTINDNCIECKVCHKKYNSRSGLWNHNQKCKEVMVEKPNTIITIDNNELITKINNLENMIIQLLKNQPVPIINNNNNLNINLFLNEQCKNAVNMIDFIKSIVFELKDFENIQDKGYIENKTNIILENV